MGWNQKKYSFLKGFFRLKGLKCQKNFGTFPFGPRVSSCREEGWGNEVIGVGLSYISDYECQLRRLSHWGRLVWWSVVGVGPTTRNTKQASAFCEQRARTPEGVEEISFSFCRP